MYEPPDAAPLTADEEAVLRHIEAELWPEPLELGLAPGRRAEQPLWAVQLLGVVSIAFAAVILGVVIDSASGWRSVAVELALVTVAFAVGLVLTLDPLRRRADDALAWITTVGGCK